MKQSNKIITLTGTVKEGIFGSGSKSERKAIYLVVGDDELVLRRVQESSFNDLVLYNLIGKTITCTGRIHKYVFLMNNFTVVDP